MANNQKIPTTNEEVIDKDTLFFTRIWYQFLSDVPNPGVTPVILQGVVAPASTPQKIGNIYIDTVLAKIYISAGTSSASDWKLLN